MPYCSYRAISRSVRTDRYPRVAATHTSALRSAAAPHAGTPDASVSQTIQSADQSVQRSLRRPATSLSAPPYDSPTGNPVLRSHRLRAICVIAC